MTGRNHSLRVRIRWVRLRVRHCHDGLSPHTRKRIVLGAFLVLLLAYGWFLFRGMPQMDIEPIQVQELKP